MDFATLFCLFQCRLANRADLRLLPASWHYDTIYIDTDGDGDITDEKPLKRYTSGIYGIIGAGDKRLNVVVTEISNDPFYVKLGLMVWDMARSGWCRSCQR